MANSQLKTTMRKDHFSDAAVRAAYALAELKFSENEEGQLRFSEATYDFTRCQRADGSFYGTSGKCRTGKDAGAKAVEPKQPPAAKTAVDTPKAAAAPAPKARVSNERIAAVRELKSKDAQLRSAASDKAADQKTRKAELDRLQRAFNAQEKAVKAEPTRENKERLKRVRTALIQQDRFYNQGQRELERIGRSRIQLSKMIERMQMSPEQRAEARRISKIIKERG